jgi:hypothetical protein
LTYKSILKVNIFLITEDNQIFAVHKKSIRNLNLLKFAVNLLRFLRPILKDSRFLYKNIT